MENFNQDYKRYERAKIRVKEIKGFYVHLFMYICVMAFLAFINLKYSPDHLWFYWPMLGWGIGVFFNGLKAYDFTFMSKDWEERKIREYMDNEKKNQNKYE